MASSLSGVIAMQTALLNAQRGIALKLDAALKVEAEAIMSASKAICPVATGLLRSTGYAGDPITTGNSHRIEVGYGGAAASYAVPVHEIESNKHAAPTSWKYLEIPLRAAAPYLISNIARRIELGQ